MKSFVLLLLFCSVLTAQKFTQIGQIEGNTQAFNQPQALSVSVDGILYVVDSGNNRIQLFDLRGKFISTIGGFGFNDDQFDNPTDIWTRSLINIYVTDFNNRRIQRYDRNMNFISSRYSDEADKSAFQFEEIISCAVNSNNDLFVLEQSERKVVKFNRFGKAERTFGTYDSGEGELTEPFQLDIYKKKYLLVSDAGAKGLFVFDFFGNFVRKINHTGFIRPAGLFVFKNEVVFLADSDAQRVYRITQDFSKIQKIGFDTVKPVSRLMDVAVFETDHQTLMYLIDGNRILIGTFK